MNKYNTIQYNTHDNLDLLIVILVALYLDVTYRRHGRAINMATGYGLDYRGVGVRIPARLRHFISLHRPDRFWVIPSLLSNGYLQLFLWAQVVKRPGFDANHSPPTSTEVKKV
jgi:hypothetical protein